MPIRLSKACKDLNVGLSTAVEFLSKKGHKIEADPNLKISDDLHLLLAKEFDKDMALKLESERLSQERLAKEKTEAVALEGYLKPEEKKEPETIRVSLSEEQKPHIKAVGHIDLDKKTSRSKASSAEEKKNVVEPDAAAPAKAVLKSSDEEKPTLVEEAPVNELLIWA